MSENGIIRYSRQELDAMRHAGSTGTNWDRIASMTEDEIERLAVLENEELGIPHDWYRLVGHEGVEVDVEMLSYRHPGLVVVLQNVFVQHYHRVLGTDRYVQVKTTGSDALAV